MRVRTSPRTAIGCLIAAPPPSPHRVTTHVRPPRASLRHNHVALPYRYTSPHDQPGLGLERLDRAVRASYPFMDLNWICTEKHWRGMFQCMRLPFPKVDEFFLEDFFPLPTVGQYPVLCPALPLLVSREKCKYSALRQVNELKGNLTLPPPCTNE